MKLLSLLVSLLALFIVSLEVVYAQDSTSTATTKKDTVKQRVETRKENIQDRIETRKELMASRAAELKDRLAKFKNKTKAEVVERISNSLNKINENRTDHFKKLLTRMEELLTKLQNRVNQAGENGKDTTSANKAINEAKTTIQTAKEAVDVQSAKDYTLEATREAKIREESKTIRDGLHTDLQTVRKLVTDAKQAVAVAIRTAATTLGGNK